MAATAARSFIRSARTRATRFSAAGAKPKAAPSPFRATTAKHTSSRISRMPVEMSFAVESMLPFHSATASSLLISMLSVTPRIYGWTIEVQGILEDIDYNFQWHYGRRSMKLKC